MLTCCKRRKRRRTEERLKPGGFIPGTGSQDALEDINTIPLADLDFTLAGTKSTETLRLEPTISLGNGITIIVGTIVGAGIFISPQGVLINAGSVGLTLLVWLFCGIYSGIGAWCYVELGLMIRKSGADYAYLYEAFGPFFAFLRLWVESMVVRPAVQAVVALACSKYVLGYLVTTFGDGGEPPLSAQKMVAICIILILTFVNCYSVRLAIRLQDIFTYGVLIALFVIISIGMVKLCMGNYDNFTWNLADSWTELRTWNFTENSSGNLWKHVEKPDIEEWKDKEPQLSSAFFDALLAYNGWNYLNFVIEELREPERNLGRAVGFSISLVTVIYILANASFLAVLTTAQMAGSLQVGNVNPVFLYALIIVLNLFVFVRYPCNSWTHTQVFAANVLGYFAFIIPVAVMLSSLGTVNGVLFTTARLFYVGAREGHMPQLLTMIHTERLTPVPAVLVVTIISITYLVLADIYTLITYISICVWLAIGVVVFSLLWLRYKRPLMKRPVKVWLGWPIIYCVITLYLILMPIYANPKETGIGLALIATGIPVYVSLVMWKKPLPVENALDKFTKFMQCLMLVTPGEMDDVNGPE